jgi:hypothetical protein
MVETERGPQSMLAMSTDVRFSTGRYERLHGRKPRGYGLWYFCLPGGRTVCHAGTYGCAKRVVADLAPRLSDASKLVIQVCG